MRIGDKTKILPSNELSNMGLIELSGIVGEITELVYSKKGKFLGAWVMIPEIWQDAQEWFIPEISLSKI